MTAAMQPSERDRLLVFAPHPDDETLAVGETLQLALAAGAAVRVVFATDGDNNPWPQRWLERRWRIGAGERARWGARRRGEAIAALAALGLEGDAAIGFLGWPDQGLTAALMRDDAAVAVLAREIAAFAPTHLVMPALGDRHPDHSALRVLLDLALLRIGSAALRLGFIVHGERAPATYCVVASDLQRQHRKQQALAAHSTQYALSRRRLQQLAARDELFEIEREAVPRRLDQATVVHIPHRPGWSLRRRQELLLLFATRSETLRWRIALPRFPRAASPWPIDARLDGLRLEWARDAWRLHLPPRPTPLVALYAKLERTPPRLVIFDAERWRDLADLLPAPAPALAQRAAAGLT